PAAPWVMIPAENPTRLMQVENAAGLALVSSNPAVVLPQPALFPLPGPVTINRSPQIFRLVGGVPGDAEVRAVDPSGRVPGPLLVSVLPRLTVKCAFHYVSNARYGTRTRHRGDETAFVDTLNDVWLPQANVRFEQTAGNTAPTLNMTDNLGDEINLNG